MFRDLLVSAWVVYSSRNTLYPWKDTHRTTTSISFTIAREPSDHIQTYLYCGQADTIDIYIYPTLSNKVVAELVESAYRTVAEEYQRHRNGKRLVYGKEVKDISFHLEVVEDQETPTIPYSYRWSTVPAKSHTYPLNWDTTLQRRVIYISVGSISSSTPTSF